MSGVERRCEPSPGKAPARRRRLHRGVELWNLDLALSPDPPRRAVLLTFTITGDWVQEAKGRMRDFWAKVRKMWLGSRYFCWAELTRAGQLHYHAWWVNPPHMSRVNLIAWVKWAWGSDRTNVKFPRDRWTRETMAAYVKKYVYKMGAKSEQQRYETMPSSFRTFMTQRLDIPPAELKHHLDRDLWEFVGEHQVDVRENALDAPRWEHVPTHLVCRGHVSHEVPPGGYCSAVLHRRPRRRPRWHLPLRGRRPGAGAPEVGRRSLRKAPIS